MDWNSVWETIKKFFSSNALSILNFFIVLVVGFFVCKILLKILKKVLSKSKMEIITQKFLFSILRVVVWLAYITTLLKMMGVDLTGLMAAIAACAVAVGLALQSSLSNLASGLILVTSKFFKSGDYVQVNGVEGTVQDIGLLQCSLKTVDNKIVHIPNSMVINNPLINYSAMNTRRVDFYFDVDYASDLTKVKEVVFKVLNSNGKILLDPAPTCRLKQLNDSALSVFTTCWCDNEDYWDVYYYVMDKVFDEFKKNDINIPFNQVEVRLRNDQVNMPVYDQELPQRVEKQRKEIIEGDFIDQLIIKQQRKSKIKRENNKKKKETIKQQKIKKEEIKETTKEEPKQEDVKKLEKTEK